MLIDACPECRGIWLDRGELDKILVMERQMRLGSRADDDFFDEVEGRRPEREVGRAEPSGYREPKRGRRRGLLEDLLDFD